MNSERFSLEEINNMSAETMRQILREREIKCLQADKKADEEARKAKQTAEKQAEAEKDLEDYFKAKFGNQHPKFNEQY